MAAQDQPHEQLVFPEEVLFEFNIHILVLCFRNLLILLKIYFYSGKLYVCVLWFILLYMCIFSIFDKMY